jgi:hypothetical protein
VSVDHGVPDLIQESRWCSLDVAVRAHFKIFLSDEGYKQAFSDIGVQTDEECRDDEGYDRNHQKLEQSKLWTQHRRSDDSSTHQNCMPGKPVKLHSIKTYPVG